MAAHMFALISLYLSLGAAAGFAAGLLGVGGGTLIVPGLLMIFGAEGVSDSVVTHLALGTSFACIVFTAFSSVRTHNRLGSVDWQVVAAMTPGIVLGALVGSAWVSLVPGWWLRLLYVLFLGFVASQMLLNARPKGERSLPRPLGLTAVGSGIGVISSFLGIGGGTMTVPFMTWCRVELRRAVGTSAALGIPMAAAGAVGYAFNGLQAQELPPYSIGFINLPALGVLVLASVLCAPLGARAAHRLPIPVLRRLFALLFYFLAAQMGARLLG